MIRARLLTLLRNSSSFWPNRLTKIAMASSTILMFVLCCFSKNSAAIALRNFIFTSRHSCRVVEEVFSASTLAWRASSSFSASCSLGRF